VNGIELSRRFYVEMVRPWLAGAVPGLGHAAALIGYGSELLGLDDEMSKDHNWGPRVHLFLAPADFETHSARLVGAFAAAAPAAFGGEPIGWRSRPHPPSSGPAAVGDVRHGLEIHTLAGTTERLLGVRSIDALTHLQWLGFAEQRLLAFTGGAVFHDDDGGLTAARAALGYFPVDVWLYKISAQWQRIGNEQAFVGRAGQAGDDLGSRVVAARLVRDIMRMGFLLERRYAPYAKWFGSAFATLPIAGDLTPHLHRALSVDAWQERGEALAAAYLVLAQRQLADGLGDEIAPVVGPYFDRPFTTINAEALAGAALQQVRDPMLRQLPQIGSVDQVTDSTPVLENPHASRRMIIAGLGAG
jgi:hypothetical protein